MGQPISSFIISADFLMTKESEQDSNLRWVSDLVSAPIEAATQQSPTIASSYFNPGWRFDRKKFFELAGINFSSFNMHFDFEPSLIKQEGLDYLAEFVTADSLVVGYELSRQTRGVLDLIGATYVDVWLGPVRFLDDITFVMRSNNSKINHRLSGFAIDPEVIEASARLIKIQTYRGFSRSPHVFDDGSALFAGQLLRDKALLCDGEMLTLLDFKDAFSDVVRNHTKVYYSRHPFLKQGDEQILAFARSFRNVEMTDVPSYHALAADEIETVCGITSSLVAEARYFNKRILFFQPPAIDTDPSSPGAYVPIQHSLLFSNFWKDILVNNSGSTKCVQLLCLISGKDKMRDALSFYWGYRKIDKLEHTRAQIGSARTKT